MNSSALLSHLMLGFKREGEGSFEVQISRRNAVIRDQFLILNSLSFHGTDVNPCHLTALGTNLHHILPPTHTIIYTLKRAAHWNFNIMKEGKKKSTYFCCHHRKRASEKLWLCPHQAPGPHPQHTYCPASCITKEEVSSKGLNAADQKLWEGRELGVQGTHLSDWGTSEAMWSSLWVCFQIRASGERKAARGC